MENVSCHGTTIETFIDFKNASWSAENSPDKAESVWNWIGRVSSEAAMFLPRKSWQRGAAE